MFNRERLIGLQEIADFFEVSRSTIRQWRKNPPNGRKAMPIIVMGGRLEASREKLEKWRDGEC